ncbi:MTERF2, partial [Symbiodinium necroappetens]
MPKRNQCQRTRALQGCVLCLLGSLTPGPAVSGASFWWNAGYPRQLLRSVAEVEFLSHLAVLLAPDQPIAELFRDFCVEPSENWASSRLSPDLAVPGVLKEKNAVLFLEYDGYYRHQLPSGIAADERKNAALMHYAPAGSRVVRVAHAGRNVSRGDDRVIEVVVSTWQPGTQRSLRRTVWQLAQHLSSKLHGLLRPAPRARILEVPHPGQVDLEPAHSFVQEATLSGGGGTAESRRTEVLAFLQEVIALPEAVAEAALRKFPPLLGCSIEANLKPTVDWLHDLGLSKAQVSKAIAKYPRLLGYSIEANLKPTVEWLHEVGLSKAQVTKSVATYPSLLGLSNEANLKPTVEWLHEVGLSKAQVTKAMATYPSLLGLSIEANLKPTVEWLHEVVLSKAQVTKAIATHPQLLGLSIEANLRPTVEWLHEVGLSKAQAYKAIATLPQLLGYSIEANLKPTVEWLHEVGLSKTEVSNMIATFPQLLGLSIEANLSPKLFLLHGYFSPAVCRDIIAAFPRLFSYSRDRLQDRLAILHNHQLVSKLLSVITLTNARFARRFPTAPLSQRQRMSHAHGAKAAQCRNALLGRGSCVLLAFKSQRLGDYTHRPAPKVEITPVETEVGTKKVITKPPRLLTQEDCETLLSKGKYDLLVVGSPLDPPKSSSTADVIAQQSAVDKFLFLLLQSMMKHEGCVQRLAVLTHDTFTVEEASHKQRGLSIVSG